MRSIHLLLSTGAIITAVQMTFVASAAAAPDAVERALLAGRAQYQPQEILVQFEADLDGADQLVALRRIGAGPQELIRLGQSRADEGDLVLARLPAGLSVAEARRALQADSDIAFAEPNWIYTHQATSNDPYYLSGELWGMYGDASTPANSFGSQAAEAWAVDHTCDSSVYIGIIDEGYMFEHEDLTQNAWYNPFDPVDGVDNDGNGYIDDVNGWDFDGGDNTVFDGSADDHGTHVAGTIAGVGGNGIGVAGVCWNATLISAKFLGRQGGTTANAILAVDYITDLKVRHGLNIVATNNSWGGGAFSQGLADAITRAAAANILFIAAASNDGSDNDALPSYPSSYDNDNIIAVASITSTGDLSSFSNWGATSVDLGAPGSIIYSTLPLRSRGRVVAGYGAYSGTSMATPHVTGAAALYVSTRPGASYLEIKNAIMSATIPTPSLSGMVVTGGRLDVSGF